VLIKENIILWDGNGYVKLRQKLAWV
jgi:hypothetical protein